MCMYYLTEITETAIKEEKNNVITRKSECLKNNVITRKSKCLTTKKL